MAPQIFRKYSHFAFSVAFFQTKWCYSPKIKHFALPPKFFGSPQNFWLATPLVNATNALFQNVEIISGEGDHS